MKKIQIKERELYDLEMECSGYWELAGNPTCASSCIKDQYAYSEAKRLSKQVNYGRTILMKMRERLSRM